MVLARANPDETILTKKFTDMLPYSVNVMENLTQAMKLPDYSNIVPKNVGSTTVKIDNMNFELPNVTDYQSLYDEMQNNNKSKRIFEGWFKECSDKGYIYK